MKHKDRKKKTPVAASTWGGVGWGARGRLRVSELLEGGTLDVSVPTRPTRACGDRCSAAFNFCFCFLTSVSTGKSIWQETSECLTQTLTIHSLKAKSDPEMP